MIRFRDGDTCIVALNLGFGVTVERPLRLVGIDSWELDDHDRSRAVFARDQLDAAFAGAEVAVYPTTRSEDKYGRIRGHVFIAGVNLSLHIVRRSLGWWHNPAHTPDDCPTLADLNALDKIPEELPA